MYIKRKILSIFLSLCLVITIIPFSTSTINAATQWSGVTAENVAATGKVKLNWSSYDGAAKYYLYRSVNKETGFEYIGRTATLSYIDETSVAGTMYYYKVKAVTSSGTVLKVSEPVARTCDCAQPTITYIGNLTATGQIELKWEDVKNANRYDIYTSTSKSGPFTKKKTFETEMNTGKTYRFYTTINVPGTTYYFKVGARNSSNIGADSALSASRSRVCDLAQPKVTISNNVNSQLTISWNEINSADKYAVYASMSKTGTYSLKTTTTKCTYTHKGLTGGKTYYYKVKAIKSSSSAANSAYSDIVSAKVKEWTDIKATNVKSSGKVKLVWDKQTSAAKYYVYRSTTKSSGYKKIGQTTSLSYTDTTGVAGKLYYYKILAIKSNGDTLKASAAIARTCDCAQPKISYIGNVASTGKIKLQWKDVKNANRYDIYRRTENGSYVKMKTFSTTFNTGKTYSYINTSAEAGKKYYYKIVARNTNNVGADSAASAEKSATCKYPNEKKVTRSNTVLEATNEWINVGVYGKDCFTIKYNEKTKKIYSCTPVQKAENLGTHICEPGGITRTNKDTTKWAYTSTWYLNFNLLPDWMIEIAEEATPELALIVDLGRIAKVTTKYEVTGDGKLIKKNMTFKFMVPSNLEDAVLDALELLIESL